MKSRLNHSHQGYGRKYILTLLTLSTVLTLALIVWAQAQSIPDPGHSANQIGAGAINGDVNFTGKVLARSINASNLSVHNNLNISGSVGIGGNLTIKGRSTTPIFIGSTFSSTYAGINLNGQGSSDTNYNLISSSSDPTLYVNVPSGNAIRLRVANSDSLVATSSGVTVSGTLTGGGNIVASGGDFFDTAISTLASNNAFCWDGTGHLGDCPGTPGDIAEWYFSQPGLEGGDIVAVSDQTREYMAQGSEPENMTIVTVGVMNASILKKAVHGDVILGVVSTGPHTIIGEDIKNATGPADRKPISLAGRVPVKVNLEGGPILVGDRIALSSVPGVGMKASSSGETFGIALEAFHSASVARPINVFVDRRFRWSDSDVTDVQSISGMRSRLAELHRTVDTLKSLVCQDHPSAEVCA